MSLLLDALKKSEEARLSNQSGQSNQSSPAATSPSVTPAPQVDNELTLEVLPQTSAHEATASDRKTAIELEPVRVAAQNLFAAKVAPKSNKINLGIVPIALISGLFFAFVGGIYIWLETSTPPTAQVPRRMAVEPAAPIAAVPESSTAVAPPSTARPSEATSINQTNSVNSVNTATALTQKSSTRSKPAANPARPPQTLPAQAALMFKPHTDNVAMLLTEGYRAYRAGDVIAAMERYQAVLQRDEKNRDALLGMAAIAQQQQNDGLAIQYYSRVLALDPRDPAAYAAMTALNLSNPASAESHLKLLIPHRPHAGILYFALGNVYADQSRWGDAQQAYFSAVNREPENAQFNFNLAVSLDHLSRNIMATQYYQRALQLDQTGAANFNHAAAQQRLQQLAKP